MLRLVSVAVLGGLLMSTYVLGQQAVPGVRLAAALTPEGKPAHVYGLAVLPPWNDGGKLVINFPEHLEYMPNTQGILRNSDTAKSSWVVAADGMTAVLDTESPTVPGVFVKGTAKVAGKDRIEVTMEIINKANFPLRDIRPLYCFHYQPLTGFPQWQENFQHTFILKGGKVVALADIPTATADTQRKAGTVKGCPQNNDLEAAGRMGGLITDGADAGIIAVTALNGPHKLILGWTPGKSVFSNRVIPCMHADPYYGTIETGKSASARAVILFTDEDLDKTLKDLADQGVGAYPGKPLGN